MSGIVCRSHGAGAVAEIVIDKVARAACAIGPRVIEYRSLRTNLWPRRLHRYKLFNRIATQAHMIAKTMGGLV